MTIELAVVNDPPDEADMSLEQFLVHLFKTEGIDFGDGDVSSIYEAVMQVGHAHYEAIELSTQVVLPYVVVALVKERLHPDLVQKFTDEKLLALAKLLYELDGYPPPCDKVKAMEAVIWELASPVP